MSKMCGLTVSMALAGMFLVACGDSANTGDQGAAGEDMRNLDAMSREHADDRGTPNAATRIGPEREIVAERLPYAEVGEELVYGYFVFPVDMVDPLPAVIMIHEWWGLNDSIRAMADRLAGQGYIVLAVDLFGGESATSPAGARELMLNVVENPEPANENVRQAFEFVKTTAGAPRIASLGWCFGGGWSLNTALLFPQELDAAVFYYGQVTNDAERLRPLEVPLLGIFAEDDRGIPLESVESFESVLQEQRKDFSIHVYPDVGHAFANPSGDNYNAEAAEDAWALTVDFLETHLKISDEGA